MRTLLFAAVLGLAAVSGHGIAMADDGDVELVTDSEVVVGQPFTVRFDVRTSEAATVEVDAASDSWGSAEVLGIRSHDVDLDGVGALHRFEVLLTLFQLGETAVSPSVTVSESGQDVGRTLRAVNVVVASTLPADAPLVLSPLPAPGTIGGGQSPFLVPGIAAAVVAVAAGALVLVVLLAGSIRRSWSLSESVEPPVDDTGGEEPLANAAGLLADDPTGAYRTIAQAVRRALTEAYELPVASMTTDELHSRLERGGVDSWVIRMATDLLSQCDAVVYAGYRPALERRHGDLAVAGEILRVAD